MRPSSAIAATPAAAGRQPMPALAAFHAYVYERANAFGWHVEWWLHVAGCRRLLKVVRHTVSHEIRAVTGPQDEPPAGPP